MGKLCVAAHKPEGSFFLVGSILWYPSKFIDLRNLVTQELYKNYWSLRMSLTDYLGNINLQVLDGFHGNKVGLQRVNNAS